MSMVFDLKIMIDFLNDKGEQLISYKKEKKAYSNLVYLVESDKNKYIYKLYSYNQRNNELEILKHIKKPQVYLFGDHFRIEEYIEHEVPDLEKDLDLIAKALADFHKLKITKIDTFQDVLKKYVQINQTLSFSPAIEKLYTELEDSFDDKSLDRVIHMDPQVGNLLKVKDSILLIDFEYSCRGNIAIDINNIFFESMADYETDSVLSKERGFSDDLKEKFIKSYMRYSDIELKYEEFRIKIKNLENLSHFLWYLWGRKYLLSKNNVSDDFDYFEWTKCRLSLIESDKTSNLVLNLLEELKKHRE